MQLSLTLISTFAGIVWGEDTLFDYLLDPAKYIKVRDVVRVARCRGRRMRLRLPLRCAAAGYASALVPLLLPLPLRARPFGQ